MSYWDLLPPEIQTLILEEKKELEFRDHKERFLPTLHEILEITFGIRWRYSKAYRNKFFQLWDTTVYGHVYRNSEITCITCKKPILEAESRNNYNYTSYTYHTLDGKYNCCYYMDKILSMYRGNLEIPQVIPIKPESYRNILYFRQFADKLGLGTDLHFKVFLDILGHCKYKYKYLKINHNSIRNLV